MSTEVLSLLCKDFDMHVIKKDYDIEVEFKVCIIRKKELNVFIFICNKP